ncbi:hypothetical protein PSTEL_04150 [Paenibacillus stellifer]|uniref:Zorya protein ZorC EH domain-containing protein n=2 Tax=Paenibacillus stellifer TaxID=169760 RepID=A0A089LTA5_9BACL|nr:hypothetical protein PSTEL_04150 [Paenibacillus stellifer]
MEVLMLIYEDYPFPDESLDTVYKINQILTARYSIEVGKTAWVLFQHGYEEPVLEDLLQRIYSIDRFAFLGLEDELQHHLDQAFVNNQGTAEGLAAALFQMEMKTQDVLISLRIEKDSKLEAYLMRELLERGLADDRIIRRDGTDFIVRLLDKYSMDDYKVLIKNYLELRKYQQFHNMILQQAVDRLRDPRERAVDWQFLSSAALKEVNSWMIRKKLQVLFEKDPDNKRLNYWKQFIDYMQHVELIQDPMIAFIYFDKFAVVEFGEMGAAYFYHIEGFNSLIYPISNSSAFRNSRSRQNKESMLKVTEENRNGIPLFIVKLDHRGNWVYKFDYYTREYLNGAF